MRMKDNTRVKSRIKNNQNPEYGSISYHLYEVGQESVSSIDFIINVFTSIDSEWAVNTILILWTAISLVMCYFGALYINECPIKREIPIYLLTLGGLGFLQISLLMLKYRQEREEDLCDEAELTTPGVYHPPHMSYTNRPSKIMPKLQAWHILHSIFFRAKFRITESIVWLILFIWFVIGNIWVLSVFRPPARQHERSPNPTFWCNAHLYNFALLQIGITHLIIFSLILSVIVLACISYRFVSNDLER